MQNARQLFNDEPNIDLTNFQQLGEGKTRADIATKSEAGGGAGGAGGESGASSGGGGGGGGGKKGKGKKGKKNKSNNKKGGKGGGGDASKSEELAEDWSKEFAAEGEVICPHQASKL
jgi:hypothetical protein